MKPKHGVFINYTTKDDIIIDNDGIRIDGYLSDCMGEVRPVSKMSGMHIPLT